MRQGYLIIKVRKKQILGPSANTVSTLIEAQGFASKSIYLELPGTINSDVNHSGGQSLSNIFFVIHLK